MSEETPQYGESEEQSPKELATSITNIDIQACVRIIDIVVKRGAFNGEEMEEVGKLRNKLARYINNQTKGTLKEEV